MMVRLQLRASVFSQAYQIRVRIKISDFEAQEFAEIRFARGKSGDQRRGGRCLESTQEVVAAKVV